MAVRTPQPSPTGRGFRASAERVGRVRKGRDGSFWRVSIRADGVRFWMRCSPRVSRVRSRGGASDVDVAGHANTLLLTYVNWCPYCQRLMQRGGAWDRLKRSNPKLRIKEFNADERPAEASRLGATTYPDIRAISPSGATLGKVPASESSRSYESLQKFAKRHDC